MNQTKYTIYWTFCGKPEMTVLHDLGQVLGFVEQTRKTPGYSAVTFCAENPDQVGKPGVDSIMDGRTPDGVEYTWTKRR